jgi:hypothetical protein
MAAELTAIRKVAAAGAGGPPARDAAGGVPRRPVSLSPGSRERVALGQTALLSSLVAGTPVPAGFDGARIRVQSFALAAKRSDVAAKVAPELPRILGDGYRPAFLAYAAASPFDGGYRRDALSFAEHLLSTGQPLDPGVRAEVAAWWRERSGPAPSRRARLRGWTRRHTRVV